MEPRRLLSVPSRDRTRAATLACIGLIAIGIAMRLAFLPAHTEDIDAFLLPWLATAQRTGAGYLRHAFTNYTAFYEHCLAAMTLFPGPALVRIKAFSMLFDVALAGCVASLVPRHRAGTAFALTLAMPTIALNSAFLAQSDAIYATLVMLSLLACTRRRPVWAMLTFSAAIAIKLQALLFAPVLVLLVLERRQPLWTFLLIPLAYAAFALPMLAAGRPIAEIGGVYGAQFGTFNVLSANAPNAWAIGQEIVGYGWGMALGLPAAMAVTAAAILALWRGRVVEHADGLLLAAAILLILAPFVTPKMHDRYFYLVDPVTIALVCRDRRYLWPMLLAECGSLLGYLPFIADGYVMHDPIWGRDGAIVRHLGFGYRAAPIIGAVAMGAALLLLVRDAWCLYRAGPPTPRRLGEPFPRFAPA